MMLDMGAIAKGYVADEALATLNQHRITSALIDAGGDLVLGDAPPGRDGWRIGIAPLDANAPPSRFLIVSNVAIATSGDAFQHVVIDGKRYSHIINPRTGLGLSDQSSVTVIARDGQTPLHLRSVCSGRSRDQNWLTIHRAQLRISFVRLVAGLSSLNQGVSVN
jgi:thiamine biosynthesis lipoprotein